MAKKKPKPARAKSPPTKGKAKTGAASSKSSSKDKSKASKKAPKSSRAPEVPLGRALVTADEKLYMLFHEDFHARQIFEFLRVETVRDLEQFSPQEIVKLLSRPIQQTVGRIRQRLADKNRYLSGDEQYLVEHKRKQASS